MQQTSSGLLVPEGAHEAAVRKALRQLDDDLRLVPVDSDAYGRRIYRVVRYQGSERPFVPVLFWGDEYGNPYEGLSVTGLLDMVQRLDRNTRGTVPDSDTRNAELVERRRREANAALDEIAREFRGRLEGTRSSPLPRSESLRRARDKVRARTKTSELRP